MLLRHGAKTVLSIDLNPAAEHVQKQNFFDLPHAHFDIIGLNPPFGGGKLAKQFVEHAAQQFTPDVMCLILPRRFRGKFVLDEYCCASKRNIDEFYNPQSMKTVKIPCTVWVLKRNTQSSVVFSEPKEKQAMIDPSFGVRIYPSMHFDPLIHNLVIRIDGRNDGKDSMYRDSDGQWHIHTKHGWCNVTSAHYDNLTACGVRWNLKASSARLHWIMIDVQWSDKGKRKFIEWAAELKDPVSKDRVMPVPSVGAYVLGARLGVVLADPKHSHIAPRACLHCTNYFQIGSVNIAKIAHCFDVQQNLRLFNVRRLPSYHRIHENWISMGYENPNTMS
jgi:hypothetical protein